MAGSTPPGASRSFLGRSGNDGLRARSAAGGILDTGPALLWQRSGWRAGRILGRLESNHTAALSY